MANKMKCKGGYNGGSSIVYIPQRAVKGDVMSASDVKKLMAQVKEQYQGLSRDEFIRVMRSKYQRLRLSASDYGNLYDQMYPETANK